MGQGVCFLEGEYEVTFRNRPVGKVSVRKQGLYYIFSCRCRLERDELCRLQVTCGNVSEDLGILVPVEGGFGIDTRIPVKRFLKGFGAFQLAAACGTDSEMLIRIYPDEPFAYINRLKKAYLVRKNGEQYIGLA